MQEIIKRLQENRNIEKAKMIVESAGYTVSHTITEDGRVDTDSTVSKSADYKTIKPFQKSDWYGWAGADNLPSGSAPYIWEDEDYTVIVSGYYDDRSEAQISIYPADSFEDQINYISDPIEELEALKLGDMIATELSAGKDLRKLSRQHGLSRQKY